MNVRELILRLQFCNQDAIVICSKDSEGNRYSPLSDIDTGYYSPYNPYSGEIVLDDEEPGENDINCIILYPIN